MKQNVRTEFLTKRDETGRFIVSSLRTGRSYFVEPIGNPKTGWGDVNPATGKVEGKYGKKFRGSIDKEDSLISDENGFKNIVMLDPGTSPLSYIDMVDAQYPDKE